MSSQYIWTESFENGAVGWGVSGPATIALDATQSYVGNKCLKVTVNNPGAATVANVFKLVPLGPEAAGSPGLYITHRAMVKASATPAGLLVTFDGLGGPEAGFQPLQAGAWTWIRGGRQADTSGNIFTQFAIAVPAASSFTLWFDYVRFEIRFTRDLTPMDTRVLLPLMPDGVSPMVDIWEYPTNVIRSSAGHEARISLRGRPRRVLRLLATELEPTDAGWMEALLWGNLQGRWTVPHWPGVRSATSVTGTAGAGQTFFMVTTGCDFKVGEQAIVWKDSRTYDVMNVTALLADRVTLVGAETFPHVAGVLVASLKAAVLEPTLAMSRPAVMVGQTDLAFEVETANSTVPLAATLPLYRGYGLLNVAPNFVSDRDEEWSQASSRVGGPAGSFLIRRQEDTPVVTRPFDWLLDGIAEIEFFRNFLGYCQGRKNGFWVPTHRVDLVLATNAALNASSITVESTDYTARQFPKASRKHLAFIHPDGSVYPVKVTGAIDNGATETLQLETPVPVAMTVGVQKISFLTWSRLDADETRIEFHNPFLAVASTLMTELPREVPV